jgi:hypothetical protein
MICCFRQCALLAYPVFLVNHFAEEGAPPAAGQGMRHVGKDTEKKLTKNNYSDRKPTTKLMIIP